HLKDRAYNIFYMGINVGAFLAPVIAEMVHGRFGFHPAFAVAAAGMVISVTILWRLKRHVEGADSPTGVASPAAAGEATPVGESAAFPRATASRRWSSCT